MSWEKTNKRFIGFFDIMGFKDQVVRNGHDIMLSKMEALSSILSPMDERAKRFIVDTNLEFDKHGIKETDWMKCPKPIIFSDSIILISHSNTKKDLLGMIFSGGWLLSECFDEQIPIKGSISYGTFTADIEKSIFFGQPLIDSYLLHEELAYYGCIFDDKAEARYNELDFSEKESLFLCKWKSVLKCGRINHLNLNWPALYKVINKDVGSPIDSIERFYKTVSGKPRMYIDNTLEFIKSIETA